MLRTGDPLEAEAWASTTIAMFVGAMLVGEAFRAGGSKAAWVVSS